MSATVDREQRTGEGAAGASAAAEFASYLFQLSPDEEERAVHLFERSIIVDMMFMGPCGYRAWRREMDDELQRRLRTVPVHQSYESAVELPREWARSGRLGDYEACWRATHLSGASRDIDLWSPADFVNSAAHLSQEIEANAWLHQALTAQDIRAAHERRHCAVFLNCQDPLGLGYDLDLLERYHALGLRMLQLTYNRMNLLGVGCTEPTGGGLSRFGRQVVDRLNDLGILVDTSHCNRETTLDTARHSRLPIVASHTGAQHVHNHPRCKSDEEITAIADSGGVIGVYAVPSFLSSQSRPSIEVMLDHVEHIAGLVGTGHVALGTDWPLQLPKWFLAGAMTDWALTLGGFDPTHHVDQTLNLVGFDDYRDYPNIVRGLVARGYPDDSVREMLGENFLRVFGAVVG